MTARIALLGYEPIYGGESTHLLALAQGLDRRRYDLKTFIPDHNELLAERLRSAQVSVTPMQLRRWNNLNATLRLAQQWRLHDIQLVHVHGQHAGLFGRMAARLAGVPAVVYTPHTIDTRRPYLQQPYFWLERFLTHWTDAIISVNESDRQRLIRTCVAPAHKIITVYHGIDADRFRRNPVLAADARRTLGIPENTPLVVQIGRLHIQKGPSFFIHAAALVLQRHPQARFVLVGQGPLQKDLEAHIAALGLTDRVSLAGWQSEIAGVLSAADVSALASLWEGLPITILEAMSAGCPVVAADVNGCREAIADGINGLLVPPRNPTALATAICRLLDDPTFAAQLAQSGRRTVEERFSPGSALAAIQAIYDRALAAKGGRAEA